MHGATWIALGELEWIPFTVLRKSLDLNLLGKRWRHCALAMKLCFFVEEREIHISLSHIIIGAGICIRISF